MPSPPFGAGGESRHAAPGTEALGGGWRLCEVVGEAGRDSARSTAIMPGTIPSTAGEAVLQDAAVEVGANRVAWGWRGR